MENVHIPGYLTVAGKLLIDKQVIDEYFANPQDIYSFLNFSVAMQIIGKQTVYIKLSDGRSICLVNIGLHKSGYALYAVIVPNTKLMTKQRWKMIALKTAIELKSEYGIYGAHLPKGSKTIRENWRQERDRIASPGLVDLVQKPHIIPSKIKSEAVTKHMGGTEFSRHTTCSLNKPFAKKGNHICIANIYHRDKTLVFESISFTNYSNVLCVAY